MNKHKGMTTVRRPMRLSQVKKNERLRKVRIALLIAAVAAGVLAIIPVSYTQLDVYKRQT